MKTIIIEIATPARGDLLIINGKSPRGGQTSAKYKVKGPRVLPVFDDDGAAIDAQTIPPETPAEIAGSLASDIFGAWLPDLVQAKVSEAGELVIACSDLCDHAFSTEVQGDGGTKLTMRQY